MTHALTPLERELLAALRQVYRVLVWIDDCGDKACEPPDFQTDALDTARAAIAKAEGKDA